MEVTDYDSCVIYIKQKTSLTQLAALFCIIVTECIGKKVFTEDGMESTIKRVKSRCHVGLEENIVPATPKQSQPKLPNYGEVLAHVNKHYHGEAAPEVPVFGACWVAYDFIVKKLGNFANSDDNIPSCDFRKTDCRNLNINCIDCIRDSRYKREVKDYYMV